MSQPKGARKMSSDMVLCDGLYGEMPRSETFTCNTCSNLVPKTVESTRVWGSCMSCSGEIPAIDWEQGY